MDESELYKELGVLTKDKDRFFETRKAERIQFHGKGDLPSISLFCLYGKKEYRYEDCVGCRWL